MLYRPSASIYKRVQLCKSNVYPKMSFRNQVGRMKLGDTRFQVLGRSKIGANISIVQEANASSSPKKPQVIAFHSSSKWKIHFDASKQTNKLMVIYFTASWCRPCHFMEPVINELAARFSNVEFVKIDVDELLGVDGEFGVQALPTFIIMKGGKQLDKVVGARKDDLLNKIQKQIT